jgi:Arc/MetJ-type ribon-helix-helix transcriptional regulator
VLEHTSILKKKEEESESFYRCKEVDPDYKHHFDFDLKKSMEKDLDRIIERGRDWKNTSDVIKYLEMKFEDEKGFTLERKTR